MDRFRKSHLVAVALALMVFASTSSALAAGRRLSDRGIESGGNPEQEVTGDPDWGSGGLPNSDRESGELLALRTMLVPLGASIQAPVIAFAEWMAIRVFLRISWASEDE
jgi:hypothetical protein